MASVAHTDTQRDTPTKREIFLGNSAVRKAKGSLHEVDVRAGVIRGCNQSLA